jgi:hypothetical protein
MTDAEEIAKGLTEARKRLILALPADGSWGKAPSRSVAKRMWWNLHLIDHKHCPEDANEWRLNERGLSVRAVFVVFAT